MKTANHLHGTMPTGNSRNGRTVSRRSRRRGAAMIEFAFVFLLLLLVVLGMMDLGRGVWTYTTVAHAARQAARYVMVHGSVNPAEESDIKQVVEKHALGLDPEQLEIETSYDEEDPKRGELVQISVAYNFRLITAPLVLSNAGIRLAASSQTVLAN